MDVKIGVTHAPKELTLDMEGTADDVTGQVEAAIAGKGSLLWFTDKWGTRVGIPVDKLAYVEIEGGEHNRHVGFNA